MKQTTYTDIAVTTDTGRRLGTNAKCQTRATTDTGIVAALRRTMGPTPASMCGERIVSISAWSPQHGRQTFGA